MNKLSAKMPSATSGYIFVLFAATCWGLIGPLAKFILAHGKLTPEMQNIMQKGMTLSEGDKLAPMQVEILSPQTNNYRHLFGYLHNNENTIIKMTLIQGLNRQIRRVCRDLGLTILKLCRISHGPIQLAALPTGKVRSLSEQEIKALYASVRLNK
ncbi:hypothetical protein [Desulfovibrio litoralis]|uniref:Pseudouridine synthase n=1 Tax=Desulfovibrio litoralis DSM 11393 TaxID=1121455 RepID=A0A1M7RRM1_9BACT|nr:hypothetical protein [Desulfovibrio litoralis]SHN48925.1 pseudouridine synthase [Desulfovibrio litoralis DSM 11393]